MDPLHITEFASDRYFSKLNQLNEQAQNATASPAGPAEAPDIPPPPSLEPQTFTLPLGNPRQRDVDHEPLPLRRSDQKKRSLGHDLTSLRTQRRPSFAGSFGRLTSKVNVIHKTPTIVEHQEQIIAIAEEEGEQPTITLSDLFLTLPYELQEHIIAPLPIHDVLNLRLVSKAFHTLVTLNENPIARYHIAHSLPQYSLRLYPVPDAQFINLHYLCSIWHRLHVATKLSTMIARQAVKEIFLRTTETQLREFEPQHKRMRQRLMPIIFTIFHFFETYRELHVRYLVENGTPLNKQAFVLNPIECQIMAMYDDQTLLKVHQAWTLVISSFSRRLRPPSYVGKIERSVRGYLKDRPPDEVYTTILAIGGLRQAQRFWETKSYNARRSAVDTWYTLVTPIHIEPMPKTKSSFMSHFGRKKTVPAVEATSSSSVTRFGRKKSVSAVETTEATDSLTIRSFGRQEEAAVSEALEGLGHDATRCNEWFCVKPSCQAARRRHSTDNLVFHSSLAAGPPMSPLPREHLQLILPDLQHLSNIWIHTAEALLLERKIVERWQDIKKNTQVLLELIKDDGSDGDTWSSGNPQIAVQMEQEGMGSGGGVSD